MKWVFILLSFGASGSVVLKVDSKQTRVAVNHPEDRFWALGEVVSIERDGMKIAWGRVTKVATKGAIVTLTHRSNKKIIAGIDVQKSLLPTPEEIARLKPKTPKTERRKERSGHPTISLAKPSFRSYFDLLFSYRPLHTPEMSFENNHSLLMFAIAPDTSTEFVFEVSPNPRFFELDYDVVPGFELRAGRIWIPFDDDVTHKFYGGRPQLTRFLQPNATAFLPEIWADLGVGMRASLLSTGGAEVATDLYVVNGFGERGLGDPHPVVASRSESYPEFGTVLGEDNNDDKALGGRLSMSVRNLLDFGASVYRGKYTNRGKSQGAVTFFGVDGRIRLGSLELKGGNIYGVVELIGAKDTSGNPVPFMRRGGYYGEMGLWFDNVRLAFRGGQSQNDSRFNAVSDQTVLGAVVTSYMGPVSWSVEYSRDIEKREGKTEIDFAAFRLSAHF